MSFTYNSDLNAEQIALKEKLIFEIQREQSKSTIRRGEAISTIPVYSDIEQFIDGIAKLVELDQAKAEKKVCFKDENVGSKIMEHPKRPGEDVSGMILYSMVRRAPGTMEGGNTPFDHARREAVPRVRDIITNDPDNPGQAKVLKSQWFDNLLKFRIVARSSTRANELAIWFENLMECNRYYFAAMGITRYLFWEREADTFEQIGNEGYYYRNMVYYARTERTFAITEQAINNIVVCLTS